MKTFAIDANNDLCLNTGGQLAFAENIQAVLNVCQHAAQTIKGEMILNVTGGLPYFETVWNGSPKINVWSALLRKRLLKVKGVTNIEKLETRREGDTLIYEATIATIYGTGTIQKGVTNG